MEFTKVSTTDDKLEDRLKEFKRSADLVAKTIYGNTLERRETKKTSKRKAIFGYSDDIEVKVLEKKEFYHIDIRDNRYYIKKDEPDKVLQKIKKEDMTDIVAKVLEKWDEKDCCHELELTKKSWGIRYNHHEFKNKENDSEYKAIMTGRKGKKLFLSGGYLVSEKVKDLCVNLEDFLELERVDDEIIRSPRIKDYKFVLTKTNRAGLSNKANKTFYGTGENINILYDKVPATKRFMNYSYHKSFGMATGMGTIGMMLMKMLGKDLWFNVLMIGMSSVSSFFGEQWFSKKYRESILKSSPIYKCDQLSKDLNIGDKLKNNSRINNWIELEKSLAYIFDGNDDLISNIEGNTSKEKYNKGYINKKEKLYSIIKSHIGEERLDKTKKLLPIAWDKLEDKQLKNLERVIKDLRPLDEEEISTTGKALYDILEEAGVLSALKSKKDSLEKFLKTEYVNILTKGKETNEKSPHKYDILSAHRKLDSTIKQTLRQPKKDELESVVGKTTGYHQLCAWVSFGGSMSAYAIAAASPPIAVFPAYHLIRGSLTGAAASGLMRMNYITSLEIYRRKVANTPFSEDNIISEYNSMLQRRRFIGNAVGAAASAGGWALSGVTGGASLMVAAGLGMVSWGYAMYQHTKWKKEINKQFKG